MFIIPPAEGLSLNSILMLVVQTAAFKLNPFVGGCF